MGITPMNAVSIYDQHAALYEKWHLSNKGKKLSDVHGKWWIASKDPFPYVEDQWEIEEAIIAALLQEGIPAWHGDAVSIVSQMIRVQSDARKKAEDENNKTTKKID